MAGRLNNALAALALVLLGCGPARAGEALRFGVVPQESSSVTLAQWQPFADALSEVLGRPVDLMVTADIPTFEACLHHNVFDLSYMNPYHYVAIARPVGYTALAHRTGGRLSGIIVARKDRHVTDLAQLAGETLAFPSPAAFGASILTRGELMARGIPFTPVFARSHESVYMSVATGALAAGGGVGRTFQVLDPAIRDRLEVIYQTPGYTPHALAASTRLDAATRQAVDAAMMRIAAERPEVLEPLGLDGLEPAGADDYADVAALDITTEMAGLTDLDQRTCPFD